MGGFFKKSVGFVKALSLDPRIPTWDKAVLATMMALLISPVDIISDFIPILGQLDDVIILVILLDYVMNRLPEALILEHWPWDPKTLKTWRGRLRFVSMLIPEWARNKIWAVARETGSRSADSANREEAAGKPAG